MSLHKKAKIYVLNLQGKNMDKNFAKYLIYNNNAKDEDQNAKLAPEDFLKYNNELWNFSLSLNSLVKLRIASDYLDSKSVNANYLFASLWAGQKEHILNGAYRQEHSKLLDWHANHTLVIRNQRLVIEDRIKQSSYSSSVKIFAKMRENLLNVEYTMEQHEQALLYTYFVHQIGFEKSAVKQAGYVNRLECVKHNFALVLADLNLEKSQENIEAIAEFLVVILDKEDALKTAEALFS